MRLALGNNLETRGGKGRGGSIIPCRDGACKCTRFPLWALCGPLGKKEMQKCPSVVFLLPPFSSWAGGLSSAHKKVRILLPWGSRKSRWGGKESTSVKILPVMRHVGGRPDQTVEEEADSEVFYDNVQSTPQNGKFFKSSL